MQSDEVFFWDVFESTDVVRLVGIPPTVLNKFIERGQYGIESSVRGGKGRGSRRLFSDLDVCGIALVWWLFESGLRSKVIQFVLNQICGGRRNSTAKTAAKILAERNIRFLAIFRGHRSQMNEGAGHPPQRVVLGREAQVLAKQIGEQESVLILPVGNRLAQLKAAIVELSQSERKG
jgi:hypothetical protein